jgi:hypothetical protein
LSPTMWFLEHGRQQDQGRDPLDLYPCPHTPCFILFYSHILAACCIYPPNTFVCSSGSEPKALHV